MVLSKKISELEDLIPSIQSRGMDLKLDRILNALNELGNPCKNIPAIQVAGTNGKGSIACFLESCLVKAGIKAGCTTSPHLITWRERIRVNGKMISEENFKELIEYVKLTTKSEKLTPFELLIASAFTHFSISQVKLMILEVGLGGRLDATTSHPLRPIIAIARIGLDHCENLGYSLEEITKEKAAVITPGSLVISSNQRPEVERVLIETTEKKNAQILWVKPLSYKWEIGISGEIQRSNAAVAKAVLENLSRFGFKLKEQQIKEGLASANWPGRLQKTKWENNPLLLDGAHNPDAIKQLAKERLNWSEKDKSIHWIIGIQVQKDAPSMLRYLLEENDFAWIVPVPNHQSWTLKELSNACPKLSHQLHEANNIKEVLELLKSNGIWPSPAPVVTGSLYLIGDLLRILKN